MLFVASGGSDRLQILHPCPTADLGPRHSCSEFCARRLSLVRPHTPALPAALRTPSPAVATPGAPSLSRSEEPSRSKTPCQPRESVLCLFLQDDIEAAVSELRRLPTNSVRERSRAEGPASAERERRMVVRNLGRPARARGDRRVPRLADEPARRSAARRVSSPRSPDHSPGIAGMTELEATGGTETRRKLLESLVSGAEAPPLADQGCGERATRTELGPTADCADLLAARLPQGAPGKRGTGSRNRGKIPGAGVVVAALAERGRAVNDRLYTGARESAPVTRESPQPAGKSQFGSR